MSLTYPLRQRNWTLELALLLPLLLLAVLAYWLAEQTVKERVRANHATATALAAQNLQLFFTEKSSKALTVTQFPIFRQAVEQGDVALSRERLRILVDTDPHLTRAFLTDIQGALWCDYPVAPESLVKNFSYREWFQGVSRTGRPYLSGVYRRHAQPAVLSLALAHPFADSHGRVRSFLVLQYSLQDLGRLSALVPLSLDGWLMLLDPDGNVVLHPHLDEDDPRRAVYRDLAPLRAALAGQGSTIELNDPLDGRAMVMTVAPLELLGRRWAVAAFQPQASAYAVLHNLRWQLALGGLLLALLVTALLRRLRTAYHKTVALNEHLDSQNQELQALNEELRESMEEQQSLSEELEQSNSELNAMQDSLQEQVDKRTRELADKDRQFQQAQKMEALGRLAGGVAHDFNNLLTVVLGHAELLKDASKPELVRESAAIIQSAAQRGAKLTSQLLSFARRQMVAPQPVDLNELVKGSLLRPLLGADVELDLQLAEGLPKALVDPVQLEQALINLVVNARDALPSRGGRISIRTSLPGPDDVVAEPPDGPGRDHCVLLSVSDNGSGMDASLLPAIFEPFFTTKAVGRGTGLGLPMVQGAVRQAGGQVTVHSALGQGSEFKLFLPIAGDAEAFVAPPDEGPIPSLKPIGATVLLVEDEEALRRLGSQVLTQAGYQVLSAPDMPSALALARAHTGRLDLLVSDLVMPGGSGVELAHTLLTQRPDLHVILMTGYTESSLPDPSRLRYRFLQKPFAPSKLLRLVQEALA